jgi:hypothetical protein
MTFDGIRGANIYAHQLGLWVNRDPEIAKAALRHLYSDEPVSIEVLKDALGKNALMRHSGYGKFFWKDTDGNAAILSEQGRRYHAVTPEEVEIGKEQWAQKFVQNMDYLVTGRNGQPQAQIIDHILNHGKAPDAEWLLDNVKNIHRPPGMLAPAFMAMPAQGALADKADTLLQGYGKVYTRVIEQNIQRMLTAPMFGAYYAKEKVALGDLKQALMDGGLSETAAEGAARDMAVHRAWNGIAKMIDDPHLKSQLDVVGRSFFAFSRATTLMVRRWSTTLWRHPEMARRYQLAAEAAIHSGLVYKDQNGDWDFYLPASGVAQEVLFHAGSKIPGLEGLVSFPTSDLSGRAATIIPGSSNPFQYSTNPFVSISGRKIASLFPDHREWFDEVDKALNGSLGQGRGAWASVEPALLKSLTDPLSNDRNAMTTSAMTGALYDMYAAGLVPKEGASPAELDDFFTRLRRQSKSMLYVRSLLGVFSPAVLSLNTNWKDADAAYATGGVKGLRAEFNEIVNSTGGDFARAMAIWVAEHPDELVYSQSSSQSTSAKTVLPATKTAYQWLTRNTDFIDNYKSVAGYFIPTQKAGEPYSQEAYRAQLEQGLREKRMPDELLTAVRISSAASAYYAMEKQYHSDLAAAKAAGNTDLARQHTADWSAWSKQFQAEHPTFGDSLIQSPTKVVTAKHQLKDLELMVNRGEVPGGKDVQDAVGYMITAWHDYVNYIGQNPGGTTAAKAVHSAALTHLQDYFDSVVKEVPQVAGIYNGVFRVLNHNLSMNQCGVVRYAGPRSQLPQGGSYQGSSTTPVATSIRLQPGRHLRAGRPVWAADLPGHEQDAGPVAHNQDAAVPGGTPQGRPAGDGQGRRRDG